MAKSNVTTNEYANSLPPEVKEGIAKLDKLMLEVGCRVAAGVVSNSKRTDGKFSYTSRKSKKTVCIINIGTSGCNISLRANHFIHPNNTNTGNILDELPEDVFNYVIRGAGCGSCVNPDLSINTGHKCVHGHAEVFEYNGIKSYRCPHYGYLFKLDTATDFEMLAKWIEYELAWGPITKKEASQ